MPQFCGRCKVPIRWGVNEATGKRQPFNFDPDPNGNRTLDEFANVHPLEKGAPVPEGHTGPFMPHHATCRYADEYRR